ncbi:hypothetical protein TPHA_0F01040 [Tetrapisispora phaffii CBS 4417]|uniref:1,3-beta-glucanosyltransferase n=1 Tax=Tetrapisispora phaffii (strain ATCC 24235 / CBS 4417 / NBRC 1672 / NRRL Y-8282 / UCD 70-5) TaxID=1071381 RepID=G8BV08_TETPH|nr:hypothetical protein TPHA_0F01040 [Tetrapisispora phaffii CBS 4417]CCE63590.1 hypothetical protein TPHA_0F01040 [Tetrapisispora phaffii CBS 4417]
MRLIFFYLIQYLYISICTAASIKANLPVIEVIGNKFFNSETHEQFFLKGIAYQPSRSLDMLMDADETFETKYIDPLADPDICLRDIPYLKKLNINTIRVYSIDPTKSHETCMQALANEGIYVLLDLAEPDVSIARDNPTWDVTIWKRYRDVIDAMSQYTNILGYFAGNEVTNDTSNTDASPFVKAAIRDTKMYIKKNSYREIPVGYSTNDDVDTRDNLAKYFVCKNEDKSADSSMMVADFYGINMYEWCGYSSYGTSGYKDRTEEFRDYPVPIFFSEFGCNLVRPRPFTEVSALFGSKMSNVWSGGLAYMYFEEENQYGVVEVSKKNSKIVKELPDFNYLETQYKNANPSGVTKEEYLNSASYKNLINNIECPKNSLNNEFFEEELELAWEATTNNLPSTPNTEECACLSSYLPCKALIGESLVNTFNVENHFKYLCGQVNCQEIIADGKAGVYGIYSSCSTEQKLSFLLSKLYYNNLHEGTMRKSDKICPVQDKGFFYNKKYDTFNNGNIDNVCSRENIMSIEKALKSDYTRANNNKVSDPLKGGNKKDTQRGTEMNEGSKYSTKVGMLAIFFFLATSLL